MRQDTGSAIVTLADGRQVGAAVNLEVVGNEVHITLTVKNADSATWNQVYGRVISAH